MWRTHQFVWWHENCCKSKQNDLHIFQVNVDDCTELSF